MKFNIILYIVLFVLLMGGCSSDNDILQKNDLPISGDTLEINGTVFIPGMSVSSTRGGFGDKCEDGDLNLTILEFSVGENAQSSFLTHIYNAECKSTTAVDNGGIVMFKVTLVGTTEARRLHLIVADDYVSPDFGSEASVFTSSAMTVGPDAEAYWGSVLIEDGYVTVTENADGSTVTTPKTSYIQNLLTNVPVIRNFAKVTVTENLDNFEMTGFELVNVPTRGTIVPWDVSSLSLPNLLDGVNMSDFSNLTYGGIVPGDAEFTNQETNLNTFTNQNGSYWNTDTKYMYEHPYESTRHTFLVIYGTYTSENGVSSTGYYKVDFGQQTNVGFDYYNIIRNYNYIVTITNVNSVGFPSLSAAIEGRVYNNITADVKMLSVSDGTNMLTVNATKHVFIQDGDTQANSFTFETAYIKDVTGSQTVYSKSIYFSLEPGNVVEKVDSIITNASKVYTITPRKLQTNENEQTQVLRVFDGNGIGRVVTLVLTRPYQYSNVIVNKGVSNLPVSNISQSIGETQNSEFTLYFNLQDGMPEEIFPLTFRIESKNQIIDNNNIGTLSVFTGESLFDPNVPAISYIKTVSYNEYRYLVDSNNIVDLDELNSNHTIRCRFKTNIAGTGNDILMIHNNDGYLKDYELTVTR